MFSLDLPAPKSSDSSTYDHSNNPRFKERYSSNDDAPNSNDNSKPTVTIPPYDKRSGFVPRHPTDFTDGGAFLEIHVAQFPLDMGRRSAPNQPNKILPLTVDSNGKIAFDAIVKQNENASKIVYSQHKDLVPKLNDLDDLNDLSDEEKEIEETTLRTKEALEKNGKCPPQRRSAKKMSLPIPLNRSS